MKSSWQKEKREKGYRRSQSEGIKDYNQWKYMGCMKSILWIEMRGGWEGNVVSLYKLH